MKVKKVFICSNCGANASKWEGKCPSCNEWNTYQEEEIQPTSKKEQKKQAWSGKTQKVNKPVLIQDVLQSKTARIPIPDQELNRTLGGGIVPGSIILIGGEPGIGKSTLLLQLALRSKLKVLYVSGEESPQQIKMRAERIGIHNSACHILSETDLSRVLKSAHTILSLIHI